MSRAPPAAADRRARAGCSLSRPLPRSANAALTDQSDTKHADLQDGIDALTREGPIVDSFSHRARTLIVDGDEIEGAATPDGLEHVIAKCRLDVGLAHRALQPGFGRVDPGRR